MKTTIALILLFHLSVPKLFGCDCLTPEKSVKETYKESDAVFVGKVIGVGAFYTLLQNAGSYTLVEFEATEIFKGQQKKMIEVLVENTSCGTTFRVGDKDLLFLFWDATHKKLAYHTCFKRPIPERLAKVEIQELRKMKK